MEIYGFPYLDSTHQLRFTMGILSAASSTTIEQYEVTRAIRQVVGGDGMYQILLMYQQLLWWIETSLQCQFALIFQLMLI